MEEQVKIPQTHLWHPLWQKVRYHSRFFVQVGHEIINTTSGKIGHIKVFWKSKFSKHFMNKIFSPNIYQRKINQKDFIDFQQWKMTLKIRILQSFRNDIFHLMHVWFHAQLTQKILNGIYWRFIYAQSRKKTVSCWNKPPSTKWSFSQMPTLW